MSSRFIISTGFLPPDKTGHYYWFPAPKTVFSSTQPKTLKLNESTLLSCDSLVHAPHRYVYSEEMQYSGYVVVCIISVILYEYICIILFFFIFSPFVKYDNLITKVEWSSNLYLIQIQQNIFILCAYTIFYFLATIFKNFLRSILLKL